MASGRQPYGPAKDQPVVMSDEQEPEGVALPLDVDEWPAGFLATILAEDSANVRRGLIAPAHYIFSG